MHIFSICNDMNQCILCNTFQNVNFNNKLFKEDTYVITEELEK